MAAIIGIDLGTTNSLVSYWDGSRAVIIPNAHGQNLTPSVVGVDDSTHNDTDILVGAVAQQRLITHPQLTAALFKRYMGSNKEYSLGSRSFRPEELSALVIRSLKDDAEAFLNEEVAEAVISVPAYFNDQQRKTTQAAGQLAGLKVERLINEPTAAAISYGLHNNNDQSSFLVFDLGGGTFDVSVLSLFDNIMEVNATAGHNALGGEDFVEQIIKSFLHSQQLEKPLNLKTLSLLRYKAEQLKCALTTQDSATLSIDIEQQLYNWTLDRKQFESISSDLLHRIRQPIERALNDAAITPGELNAVILVGGATRMPLIRSLSAKMFSRYPTSHQNPDEVVAMGAAIQAGLKSRHHALKEVILTDVCPYTLGIETVQTQAENHSQSGQFSPIIERNTVIPVSKESDFYSCNDNQPALSINIFQGESRLTKNNIKLGGFSINIPPAPAGEQGVTVRFTYDINGILEVQATTHGSGEVSVYIIENNDCQLSKEEIRQRFKALEALKAHPRDQLENRMTIARGERLYEQSLGDDRHTISRLLLQFEAIIDGQNTREIDKHRKQLDEQLNLLESQRI